MDAAYAAMATQSVTEMHKIVNACKSTVDHPENSQLFTKYSFGTELGRLSLEDHCVWVGTNS